MKVGINRSKIEIDVMGTVLEIGIVPLLAHQLIAQHDNAKDLDEKIEILFKVIEAILTANGYEYNRRWWEKTCDYEMLQEVIILALQKDIPPTKDKKKAGVHR